MVFVRVSETYDLSTKVGKMGIVAIHTPTGSLIDKMWPGLVLQHKKVRFVKCDVAMACASMLPADPLQIGVEAGAIAPQDMFNPILFRAVSNDAMSNIQSYIQGFGSASSTGFNIVNQGSVVDVNDPGFKHKEGTGAQDPSTDIDAFSLYYGLLADSDSWKKAMPQSGLTMRGLYPLVFQVVSNYGVNGRPAAPVNDNKGGANLDPFDDVQIVEGYNVNDTSATQIDQVVNFRGPPMRMPAFDTTIFDSATARDNMIVPSANVANVKSNVGYAPACYVGLIVLPPAKLNQLYYRLKVTWTVEFTGLRSMADIASWTTLAGIGNISYGTDYAEQSQAMSAITNMVDTDGAAIEKIMEGA
ncbi:capsid protein [Chicken virus mg5_1345]|uniref:Capsid protein n=1 Tax=Chicken virus mg5_1345 TaxID=2720904 RepID=A0A6G9W0Y2_9VIRU|nr:capsid protein [Chicken virus mg5_1345]